MKTVQWMLTGRCNLNCRHCYMAGCQESGTEPAAEDLLRTMDLLVREGVREVVLTGGEPLFRKDVDAIFRALTEKGLRISRVITNGSLLTPERLDLLRALGQAPVFNLSYDGDGGGHEDVRRKPGIGREVLAAFDLCRERGFRTASDVTVHRGSAARLNDTLRTLDAHGCSLIKVMPLFPIGNGAREMDGLTLSGAEFLDLACRCIPAYYADGLSAELYLGNLFYARGAGGGWALPMLALSRSLRPREAALCRRDSQTPFLSAAGKLMPCPGMLTAEHLTGEFGKVAEYGLAGAQKAGAFDRLTNYTVEEHLRRNPECRACEWALSCGGGCRSAAMAFEGSFFGKDPFTCAFFRENGAERLREAAARGMLERAIGAKDEGTDGRTKA